MISVHLARDERVGAERAAPPNHQRALQPRVHVGHLVCGRAWAVAVRRLTRGAGGHGGWQRLARTARGGGAVRCARCACRLPCMLRCAGPRRAPWWEWYMKITVSWSLGPGPDDSGTPHSYVCTAPGCTTSSPRSASAAGGSDGGR